MFTSEKLKKPINRSRPKKALNKPFAPAILSAARTLAGQYQIVLTSEDGHWYGHGLELSTVFGDGATPDAAVADTREALATATAYMLENHQRPPAPASEGRRSVQINVRLTLEEKRMLETKAKISGFRGLSDFIRTSVMSKVS